MKPNIDLRPSKMLMAVALLALLAPSCSVISRQIKTEALPSLPFNHLVGQSQRYQGRTVILGGYILETKHQAGVSQLKILQTPLMMGDEPRSMDYSQGRFMVEYPGYLDPAVYAQDRKVTVAGTVNGTIMESGGDYPYPYLRLKSRQIYLWAQYAPYRYDPFYDYWYYPYHPYHHSLHHRW